MLVIPIQVSYKRLTYTGGTAFLSSRCSIMLAHMPPYQVLVAGSYALAIGAFAAVICLAVQRLGWGKHIGRLPPGPPGHWLLGNTPPTS